jgi:hypothetical protein
VDWANDPDIPQGLSGPRLIIHSGTKANSLYPWSLPLNDQDVTIDTLESKDPMFLNPTYVIQPGSKKDMAQIAVQYEGAFSQIIVDHMGTAPHDVLNPDNSSQGFFMCSPAPHSLLCYGDLFDLFKIYNSMLAPGGVFIYRGNRYSRIETDKKKGDTDVGYDDALKMCRTSLEKMMGLTVPYDQLTSEQILQYLKDYYSNLLEGYFNPVKVKINQDSLYEKYNPVKSPYYYLQIVAIKNSATISKETPAAKTAENSAPKPSPAMASSPPPALPPVALPPIKMPALPF